MATANVKYTVQSESYTSSIVPRIYDCLKRGTYGDCTLAVEGKVILAHKLILAGCSEYFEVSQAVRVKTSFDEQTLVPSPLRIFSKPATTRSRSSFSAALNSSTFATFWTLLISVRLRFRKIASTPFSKLAKSFKFVGWRKAGSNSCRATRNPRIFQPPATACSTSQTWTNKKRPPNNLRSDRAKKASRQDCWDPRKDQRRRKSLRKSLPRKFRLSRRQLKASQFRSRSLFRLKDIVKASSHPSHLEGKKNRRWNRRSSTAASATKRCRWSTWRSTRSSATTTRTEKSPLAMFARWR